MINYIVCKWDWILLFLPNPASREFSELNGFIWCVALLVSRKAVLLQACRPCCECSSSAQFNPFRLEQSLRNQTENLKKKFISKMRLILQSIRFLLHFGFRIQIRSVFPVSCFCANLVQFIHLFLSKDLTDDSNGLDEKDSSLLSFLGLLRETDKGSARWLIWLSHVGYYRGVVPGAPRFRMGHQQVQCRSDLAWPLQF